MLGRLTASGYGNAASSYYEADADANQTLSWSDYFTVTGPAEADGMVHLPWSFSLADSLAVVGGQNSNSSASTRGLLRVYYANTFPVNVDITDATNNPLAQHTYSGVLALPPGATFFTDGSLFIDGYANVGTLFPTPSADSQVLADTAEFHLDPDPLSGGFYTTASGHDYNKASIWAAPVSGNWSDPAKWIGGAPNAAGAMAVFSPATTAALTVNLDAPQTVGELQFSNSASASTGYILSGSDTNALTLDKSGSDAIVLLTGGTHAIDAPVILADNLVVTSGGTSAWMLSFGTASSITDNSGSRSLTMSGSNGTLILSGSNDFGGGTFVTAGTLIVTSNEAIADGTNLTVGNPLLFGSVSPATVSSAAGATPVPEPEPVLLLAAGGIALAAVRSLKCRRVAA